MRILFLGRLALLWGMAWSVPANEAFLDEEPSAVDPGIRVATEHTLLRHAEHQRQCQISVELWRVDWERGVTRFTEDNHLRPWAGDVILQVDALSETLHRVEEVEVRDQLLADLEAIALQGCQMRKQMVELLVTKTPPR